MYYLTKFNDITYAVFELFQKLHLQSGKCGIWKVWKGREKTLKT